MVNGAQFGQGRRGLWGIAVYALWLSPLRLEKVQRVISAIISWGFASRLPG